MRQGIARHAPRALLRSAMAAPLSTALSD